MSNSQRWSTVALLLTVLAADATACGSSLFGVGQRARFQQARAAQPANVLIYSDSTGAGAVAVADAELHASLEKAGHHVTVVSDAQQLGEATRARSFDVVIADFEDVAAIRSSLVHDSGAAPDIVPVVDRRAGTERLARDQFQWCVRASAGASQYLRLVQKVMASRLP